MDHLGQAIRRGWRKRVRKEKDRLRKQREKKRQTRETYAPFIDQVTTGGAINEIDHRAHDNLLQQDADFYNKLRN